MKTFIAFILLLPSITLAGQFSAPTRIQGTQYLFRGPQPIGQVQKLETAGIEQVIIFKNDVHGEVSKEISELEQNHFADSQIHPISMKWKDIDLKESCAQSIEALRIMIAAEQNKQN